MRPFTVITDRLSFASRLANFPIVKYVAVLLFISTAQLLSGQQPVLEWAKQLEGTEEERIKHIKSDALGNIYAIGTFQDAIDLDPGSNSYHLITFYEDNFIAKYNVDGQLVWALPLCGNTQDRHQMDVDSLNNIYIIGSFSGTQDFDPGLEVHSLTSSGFSDIFILKLDSDGNFIWVKNIGGNKPDKGNAIKVRDGNIYATGFYENVVDFDPGQGTFNLFPNGDEEVFILKLSTDGAFVWAKSVGGSSDDFGTSITIDSFSNVYISGGYLSSADFDPDSAEYILSGNYDYSMFILKLSPSGSLIWAKRYRSSDQDPFIDNEIYNADLSVDKNGDVYASGHFNGTASFGVTSHSNSKDDFFLLKIDHEGNLLWAHSFGAYSNDYGGNIRFDSNNHVFLLGYYKMVSLILTPDWRNLILQAQPTAEMLF